VIPIGRFGGEAPDASNTGTGACDAWAMREIRRIPLSNGNVDSLVVLVNANKNLVYQLNYRDKDDQAKSIATLEISGEEFDRVLRIAAHR